MSDTSLILSLPYLQPSQAQKHVTHNEALRLLDVLVQTTVQDRDRTAPPSGPVPGDCHIVAAGATGLWDGQVGRIAHWTGGDWEFFAARPGWQAQVLAEDRAVVFDGLEWSAQEPVLENLDGVGIGTGSDPTNRLAVASAATLLTHDGAGHQLKVNKATSGDTASLVFQTNYSGRAEMGTAGSDAFEIKVSPDGATWSTGLSLDPATGQVGLAGAQTPAAAQQAGGNSRTEGGSPALILHNSTASAGERRVALFNSNNWFAIQTLTDGGGYVSNDYSVYRDANGATFHQWSVQGAPCGRWSEDGLAIGTTNTLKRLYVVEAGDESAVRFKGTHAGYTQNLLEIDSTRAGSADFAFARFTSGSFADAEFKLSGDGNGSCDGSWTGGGADYAEFFEWADGNPDAEDRRGISVVLEGDLVREAAPGEDPVGVISGNPSVVGDGDMDRWKGKYLRDAFGGYLWESYEVVIWSEEAQEGPVEHSYATDAVPEGIVVPDDAQRQTLQRRVLNPSYDPDLPYTPRAERQEWDMVGLMGKLRLRKGQVTGARWVKMRDIDDALEEWLVR
jgi:hypothetical protein